MKLQLALICLLAVAVPAVYSGSCSAENSGTANQMFTDDYNYMVSGADIPAADCDGDYAINVPLAEAVLVAFNAVSGSTSIDWDRKYKDGSDDEYTKDKYWSNGRVFMAQSNTFNIEFGYKQPADEFEAFYHAFNDVSALMAFAADNDKFGLDVPIDLTISRSLVDANYEEPHFVVGVEASTASNACDLPFLYQTIPGPGLTSATLSLPPIDTAGVYEVCVSPDGGITFYLQDDTFTVEAHPDATDLTVVPGLDDFYLAGAGLTPPTLNFVGLTKSLTTYVALAPPGSCNTIQIGAIHYTASQGTTAFTDNPTAPGDYAVCYSKNGEYWVEQSNIGPLVFVATSEDDLAGVVPTRVGKAAAVNFPVVLDIPSADADINIELVGGSSGVCESIPTPGTLGTLTCTGGEYIVAVRRAFMGNPNATACSNAGLAACSVDVSDAVAAACLGETSCPSLSTTGLTTVYGDPCAESGIDLGLVVEVICGKCGTGGYTPLTNPYSPTELGSVIFSGTVPAGTYGFCLARDVSSETLVFQTGSGAQLTIVEPAVRDVYSVYPRIIGEDVFPALTFGGLSTVATASTTISLMLSSESSCQSNRESAVDSNAGDGSGRVQLAGGSGDLIPGEYTVCISHDAAQLSWSETLASVVVVKKNPGSLGLEPTTIAAGSTPTISVPNAVVTDTGTRIRIATDTGCGTPVEDFAYDSPGLLQLTGSYSAANYYICYSVSNGAEWAYTGDVLQAFTLGSGDITVVDPTDVYLGDSGPVVKFDFTGGSPGLPGSYISIVPFGESNPTVCDNSYEVAWTSATEVVFGDDLTAGSYVLCYTISGPSSPGDYVIQSAGFTVYGLGSASSVTDVSVTTPSYGYIPNGMSGVVLSFTTGATPPSPNALVGLAQSGKCSDSRLFTAAYSTGVTVPGAITATAGLGSTVTAVVCYSNEGARWFQQSSGSVTIAVEHPFVITAVSPSVIVAGTTSVEVTHTGLFVGESTYVALVPNTGATPCASVSGAVQAASSTTVTHSGLTPSATGYAVCYSSNGNSGFVRQLAVTVAVTNDAEKGRVSSALPLYVGGGSRPTMTLTFPDAGYPRNDTYIAFALPGECNVTSSRYGVTLWDSAAARQLDADLPVPTVSSTVYQVCYRDGDTAPTWHEQATPSVTVVQALNDSIVAVAPNAGPTNIQISVALTFGNDVALATQSTVIRFTTTDCLSGTDAALPYGNVVNYTLPATTSTVLLCVDTGTGFVEQTGVSIAAIDALPDSIEAVSPRRVAAGLDYCVDFDGADVSPDASIALATPGNCDDTRAVERSLDGSDPCGGTAVSIPNTLAAGVYDVCYSVNSVSYVTQTEAGVQFELVGATNTSITSIAPRAVGASSTPMLTIGGGTNFTTSYVAFHPDMDSCDPPGSLRGHTTLENGPIVPLGNILSVNVDPYFSVCYSVNYEGGLTGDWVRQDLADVNIEVVEATGSSIAYITPTVIGGGVITPLSFTDGATDPLVTVPGGKIGFVTKGSLCISENVVSVTALEGSSLDVSLSAALVNSGDYTACYSTDGGSNYVAQSPTLKVFNAGPTTVASLTPAYVGAGTQPTVTLTSGGQIATPSSKFAFVTGSGVCSNGVDRVAETAYTSSGATVVSEVLSGPAGVYRLCFSSNNGSTWFEQNPSFELVAATATSVDSIAPTYFSTGVNETMTVSGVNPVLGSLLGFVRAGVSCTAGNLDSQIGLSDGAVAPIDLARPLVFGGVYQLCYSVDGGASFAKQAGVNVTVTNGTANEVASLQPSVIGNGTTAVLSSAASVGYPPSAVIALAADTARRAGPCDGPFVVGPVAFSTTLNVNVPLAAGDYALCVATDGSTFVQQTVSLSVVAGSSGAIVDVDPVVYEEGEYAYGVTFTGAIGTPTTYVAFYTQGSCGALDSSMSAAFAVFAVPTSGVPVDSIGPVDSIFTYANLSVCYTVDGGVSWYDQTAVYVTVDSSCGDLFGCDACNSNSKCAFCLSSYECKAKSAFNGNCTGADLVTFQETCPRITTSTVRMPVEGGFNLTLEMNNVIPSGMYHFRYEDAGIPEELIPAYVINGGALYSSSPNKVEDDENVRQLSVIRNGIPYSENWIVFQYYDCSQYFLPTEDAPGCSACYDASDRPLCGTCLAENSCTVNRTETCAASSMWLPGGSCPTISNLSPSSVTFGVAGEKVVVSGGPFFDTEWYVCDYGAVDGTEFENKRYNATYISGDRIECTIPPFDPPAGADAVSVPFIIDYDGQRYTTNEETFLYSPPQKTPEIPRSYTGEIVGGVTGFILLVIALVALGVYLYRDRQWKLAHTPPALTPAVREKIVFGKFKDFKGDYDSEMGDITQLLQLLMLPGNVFAYALTDVTAATEADNVAKSLVVLWESEGMLMDMLLDYISREVDMCISQSTLFRTNSFATKMFKTYSKMQGVDYLHDTLGFVLNTELSMNRDVSFDLKSDDAQMASFTLLTVCQRIFMRIVQSEGDVPPAFRKVFHHVKTCMVERFPVTSDDIASVVAEQLNQRLEDTASAFELGNSAYLQVSELSAGVSDNLAELADMLVPMQDRFANFQSCVMTLEDQINAMMKDFDKLEGALVPNSEAARRMLQEHSRTQSSVAVGGFFFLRFLVPAITAPEAYHLVRELPNPDQRKLLVMVGKVVQNLSNGLEFGKKESHMVKLNEFIIQNRNVMHQLFDTLSTPTDADISVLAIPPGILKAAKCVLFEHICRVYDKIVDKLTEATGDAEADQKSEQVCNMFRLQMDAINSKRSKRGRGVDSMSFSLATSTSTKSDAAGGAFLYIDGDGGAGASFDDRDRGSTGSGFNPNDLIGSLPAGSPVAAVNPAFDQDDDNDSITVETEEMGVGVAQLPPPSQLPPPTKVPPAKPSRDSKPSPDMPE